MADAAPTPVLNWADCADGFQCATAKVPRDYQTPHGTTIDLAMIKLSASDPAHRIGTLFINFGGPGESGVDRLRQRAKWPWLFSQQLRSRFDLVSWDSRAVSHSTAVRCFATSAEQQWFFGNVPDMPADPSGEPAFYRASQDLTNRCQQRAGDLLPYTNSVNTARDLDLMRRAVGDATLTYHGISYGTYIGALYTNLFPGRVRALVLDGSLDFQGNATGHGDTATRLPVDTRQGVANGIAETFESFLTQCAAAGSNCEFSGGDLHAKWRILAERAREHPIAVTNPDGTTSAYSYSAVVNVAASLAKPETWKDTARTLQKLYQASGANVAAAGSLVAKPQAAGEQYPDNVTESFNAIQCADSVVPTAENIYSKLAANEDSRVGYFGRVPVFDMMTCAYWPRQAVLPYRGPWNRVTASPIMVINSRFDPATPLKGAIEGTRELANARLLVVEGSGHSSMYLHSTCAERAKRDYLISGVLPADGATCGIDHKPFDPA
jgi:pimeloyl-ACP methyl ester carboxylesterase